MRILVLYVDGTQKGPDLFKLLVHRFVGVEYELAREEIHIGSEPSVIIHRRVDVQSIFKADLIIFLAVTRSDMDTSRSCVKGYEGSEYQHALSFDERVPAFQSF